MEILHERLEEPLSSTVAPIKTFVKNNKQFPALNGKVNIETNEVEGRFAKATENIKVGENILTEEPYASILLQVYAKTHCYQCMKRVLLTPFPCKTCSNIIFCSANCQQKATSSHHTLECPILPFIWKSGLSVICYLSLRIMTQANSADFFKTIKQYLEKKEEQLKLDTFTPFEKAYIKVHSFITHSDKRAVEDYVHTAHVATFLFQLLKSVNYFKTNDEDLEDFIGGLLLHQIQFLQYNSHEVADLVYKNGKSKSRFLGAAIYPTLSYFNHSCEPNLVRYFRGTKVYVNLCKNIKKGDKIYENYGPLYSEVARSERQETLKIQYRFQCNCIACEQDWPSFEKMERSLNLRFKCETSNCMNVVTVPINTNEFMIKCEKCDMFINIFKGLKSLQDTDSVFRLANNYQENKEYSKALEKYFQLLKLLDENLVPPYRDYILCQKAIQDCFLNMGEVDKTEK